MKLCIFDDFRNGQKIAINPMQVRAITPIGNKDGVVISFDQEHDVAVRGAFDQVANLIGGRLSY